MTQRTKNIITEIIAIAVVIGFAVFFWHSLQRLEAWTKAEVDQIEQNYLPVSDYKKIAEVVSPPSQFLPQHIVTENGHDLWFGDASWYDYTFREDGSTRPCFAWEDYCYTRDRLVAASRDFPRGTELRVTNLSTGDSVIVLITDFGPDGDLHPERVIDLSSYAFGKIAGPDEGIIAVKVEEILS